MSSAAIGVEVDLDGVLDLAHLGEVGVPDGPALLAFANAVELGDPDVAVARASLAERAGPDAVLEGAATVAIFNGLVRVADGTGIQLDDGVFAVSADDRHRLGIDAFAGAANTSPHDGGPATDGSADRGRTTVISELFG